MSKKISMLSCGLSLTALILIASCAPQKMVKKSETSTEAPSVSTGAATAPSVEVQEGNIRGGEYAETPELRAIHFDYDSYNLRDQDRAVLKENADYLKAHVDIQVEVAGHCDERGTIQYNLALGQRRAKATRDYYMRLGVSGKSVATISYGKEKPQCRESTEECWAKNRRAETLARKHPSQSSGDSAP